MNNSVKKNVLILYLPFVLWFAGCNKAGKKSTDEIILQPDSSISISTAQAKALNIQTVKFHKEEIP